MFKPSKGDVYKVFVEESKVQYFQYLGRDKLRFNSDIIIVYKGVFDIKEDINYNELIHKNNIYFIAHTSIITGLRLKEWSKAFQYKLPDNLNPKFRVAKDYKSELKTSDKWYVWSLKDKEYNFVGNIKTKLSNSHVGIVFSPYEIIRRIKFGKNNFTYPKVT
jgi:hypothetical protein